MDIFVPPLKPAPETLMVAFHGFPHPNFVVNKTSRWAKSSSCIFNQQNWFIKYKGKYKDTRCPMPILLRLGNCMRQFQSKIKASSLSFNYLESQVGFYLIQNFQEEVLCHHHCRLHLARAFLSALPRIWVVEQLSSSSSYQVRKVSTDSKNCVKQAP